MSHLLSTLLPPISPTLNTTLLPALTPTHLHPPLYPILNPSFLPHISDKSLNIITPILCYWIPSLLFHLLDTLEIPYFEKRRIHDSEEMKARNKASVRQVIGAVVAQHVVQALLAYLAFEPDEAIQRKEVLVDHLGNMGVYARVVVGLGELILGRKGAEKVLPWLVGRGGVEWLYWWGIPIFQMGFAFFIIDTWQYFLHRFFHTIPFLYRHFHSVHHRLYVPYAFGALYNHPLEGLLFDSLGALCAHFLSLMTTRQATLLFAISSVKTVDDHCGYKLWWDPCQAIFGNNAEYHDLHHQSWGIKKNFSQPFFTNWDALLGTRMTKSEGAKIYARRRAASQSKLKTKTPSTTLSDIDPPPSQLDATIPLFPLDRIQANVADIGAVPAIATVAEGSDDGESGSRSGNGSLASTPETERTESGSLGMEVDSGVEVSDGSGLGSEGVGIGVGGKGKKAVVGKGTALEGPQTRARVRKSAKI